jgi:hypothetical protein
MVYDHTQPQMMVSDVLKDALANHVAKVLQRSPTNKMYAERVAANIHILDELANRSSGSIEYVVTTWREDFLPIASIVFGRELTLEQISELPSDYTSTAIEGLLGKVSVISEDEIMGPMFSLDLTKT